MIQICPRYKYSVENGTHIKDTTLGPDA